MSGSVTAIKNRWESLEDREKLSLKVMFVALTLAIAYFAIWSPAHKFMVDSQRSVEDRRELLALVISSRQALARSGAVSNAAPDMNSQQLVSTVTNMARTQQLSLKRFEPSGENKIKVWVEDVSFDNLVAWLSKLDKAIKVSVEQISVEKQDKPGVVSARLTLSS